MLALLSRMGDRIAKFLGEPQLDQGHQGDHGDKEDLFGFESLASVLPFESYDPDSQLFIGPSSMGFVIEALPLVGGGETAQTELLSLVEEVMEEGSSLQTLLWADPRISSSLHGWEEARVSSTYRIFARKRSAFLKESGRGRVFRFILSYSVKRSDDPSEQERLSDLQRRILKTLSSLTHAYVWEPDSFLTCVGDFLGHRRGSDVHQRSWNPYDPLANQLTCGGMLEVNEDGLQYLNEEKVEFRSYRVVDYPSNWPLTAMQNLIGDVTRDAYRLEVPFYLHYGIHLPDQERADRSFRRRSQLIENQGKSRMLLRLVPDLEEELSECDHIRRSVNQGGRYVQTQFSSGVWALGSEMPQAEQALKSLLRINGFTVTPNHCLHLPMLFSALPMTWSEYVDDFQRLNLLKTTLSSETANFFPIQGEWMGTPTPGMLLVGRRGQLVNWNPFDNRAGNYNTVVVGRSGSGKSVFIQDLILSGLGTGGRVYVLEVGRSFEKLCSSLGGQSLAFEREASICLNPFTSIPVDDEEGRLAAFSMLKSVISCMASPSQGTTDYETALIEQAIGAAWLARGPLATITDVARWLLGRSDSRAQTMGTMLAPYSEGGIHARYFEGENNVDFSHPMVLIELEELKHQKDLQAVVLQLCIMTITNQAFMGDRKTPFYICIDEAWDLMRAKQTEEFIETLARRLRKYNGSLVIGTQSVDDFFETPGARAAFENSDWMCFLAQKKGSISRLINSGKLNMDDSMQAAMESVTTRHGEYSEVMICDADGNYSIARLLLDPFSQLLFSTKADEYARLKDLQEEGLSIADAISHLLQQRNQTYAHVG